MLKIIQPKIYSKLHEKVFDVAWINYENMTALSMEYKADDNDKVNERTFLYLNNCIILPAVQRKDNGGNQLYLNDIVRVQYQIDNEIREGYNRIEFHKKHGYIIDYTAKDNPNKYYWAENLFDESTTEWTRIMNYYDDVALAKRMLKLDTLISKIK